MFNHTKEKANHPNILLYLLPGLVILGIVLLLLGRFSAKEAAMAPEGFSIEKLTFCHYQNPLGIDDAYPVFGWQMKSSKRGSMQSAYRITVSESADALKSGTYLWDSGKVLSGLSVGIPYEGPALSPQTRYYWQVSVWDENDTEAVSTAEAFFETGLLAGLNSQTENTLTGDAGSMPEDGADNSCMTVFGDAKWISAPGKDHVPGAILLHGWYDRAVGYPEIYNPWGDTNALLGKLEIKYTDGTVQVISTDQSFLCSTDTPVRNDDIYQGEFYDANKEFAGFDLPGFDASGWTAAAENQVDEAYLTLPAASKISEPIVCIRELTPLTVTTPAENISVYDFGQNFAGTCRIRVKGEKGQILILRYGEHLNTENLINKDDLPGTVFTENLLTADATDYYVLKGDAKGEIFVPEFTYHGFRYLQIEGLKEPLAAEDVQGLVLSTDLPQTGSFECSDPLLNQYYQNTINSMQSNFMDNPTDCPQRDERHGWAGDAQVFSGTASYHADTYSFYRKYLDDMRLLQTDGGSFTDMAPRNFGTNPEGRGGAATNNCWGDAPVVITWNLYTQYGDVSILKENYEALCKWVDVLEATSENYIRRWGGYGDHLALESTPAEITDTAWCARSADLLSRMANILDKPEDAARYRVLYENFKTAWQNAYILPDGMTVCNSQTSYALGLSFGLFPEELVPAATGFFLQLIENSNYHINTGFSGIGYLLPSLSAQGHDAAAYNLLLQKEAPSLLSQVQKGATTTWEMWDAYREEPDGTYFLDGSFNHYTYGTSAGFLYTHTLGITSDENNPGFKHFYLAPHIMEDLSYAGGSYESAYGLIASKWERTKDGYRFDFTVPANTTATLTLPALPDGKDYFEGKKAAVKADGVTLISKDETKVVYGLSSGNYSFTEGK